MNNKTILAKKIYTLSGLNLSADLKEVGNILHIGCGHNKLNGSVGIDILDLTEVDVVHNLDVFPWPFEDSSFDFIFAHNIFEHLDNIPNVMNEVHRLLSDNGRLVITVPYFRHIDAVTDPTHKHFFTSRSFNYFIENEGLANYDYAKNIFKKIDFWYGWPHDSKNIFKRFIKRIIQFSNKYYDQYISLFFPSKIIIWELEKISNLNKNEKEKRK